MDRRKFIGVTGGSIIIIGGSYYAFSDRSNFIRSDLSKERKLTIQLLPDEQEILYLASLAPSGHTSYSLNKSLKLFGY